MNLSKNGAGTDRGFLQIEQIQKGSFQVASAIKAVILDQNIVAGVGNIYAGMNHSFPS